MTIKSPTPLSRNLAALFSTTNPSTPKRERESVVLAIPPREHNTPPGIKFSRQMTTATSGNIANACTPIPSTGKS